MDVESLDSVPQPLAAGTDTLFEHVVVINLKRRPDRKQRMQEELDRAGLTARFFEAVDGQSPAVQRQFHQYLQLPLQHKEELRWRHKLLTNPGMLGVTLSALAVVGRAFAQGWPSVLIMEDDVRLCANFKDNVTTFFQDTLGSRPWKVVPLGASDFHHQERPKMKGYYHACRGVYGFFCVAIHQSAFQDLLQLLQLQSLPPDVCLNCVYERYPHQCFVPYPNLAVARLDDSDIHPYQQNRLVTREGQSKETQFTQSLAEFTQDYIRKVGWDKAGFFQ